MPLTLDLFLTFFKIGLFTFGGGYAMIPLIEDICVDKRNWITHDDMMNVTVIAESTPGPIAINCATFVGYKQAGIWGAVAATFGVVLPSFWIIFLIARLLDNFLEIAAVVKAFRGIRIAVGLLILRAALSMLKKMKRTPLSIGIGCCACAGMLAVNFFSIRVSSIAMMLAAGGISWLLSLLNRGKEARHNDLP